MPFSNIRGQDKALSLLKAFMNDGRIAGGYIFSGPASIGKKMTAKILSQALNCESNSDDACGACPSCLKIENNSHPDVHVVNKDEMQIKIESIRQLQKEINLKAYEGRFKIFIIDNAHTLTSEAANCLLKVLEEPPQKTLIILITDKPGLLFKTIISRCKTVKFHAAKREELAEALSDEYNISGSLAHFLSYFCEGRTGEALRLKDSEILKEKNDIINKIAAFSHSTFEEIDLGEREILSSMLNILSAWFRDMYFLKIGIPASELINYDRKEDLKELAGRFSYSDLDRIMGVISNSAFYLERNINTRLLLHNLRAQIWEK